MHLSIKLLKLGFNVVGIDNLNDYYDKKLKVQRLKNINLVKGNFSFYEFDLIQKNRLEEVFKKYNFEYVVNLAAQAGVRFSIENPKTYIESNIMGFFNILEACRYNKISHLLYASSSSVYGINSNFPFKEDDNTDSPISLYGATKKTNEVMAFAYSHLYNIPSTALRFFTVYGPWGRPDMAPFIFAKAILGGKPINLYNNGNMIRDFTYIDDVVEAILGLIDKPPIEKKLSKVKNEYDSSNFVAHKILNVGKGNPINIKYFIELLEKSFDKKAIIKMTDNQLGDVQKTGANLNSIKKWIDFSPSITIENGVENFVNWFKSYYK